VTVLQSTVKPEVYDKTIGLLSILSSVCQLKANYLFTSSSSSLYIRWIKSWQAQPLTAHESVPWNMQTSEKKRLTALTLLTVVGSGVCISCVGLRRWSTGACAGCIERDERQVAWRAQHFLHAACSVLDKHEPRHLGHLDQLAGVLGEHESTQASGAACDIVYDPAFTHGRTYDVFDQMCGCRGRRSSTDHVRSIAHVSTQSLADVSPEPRTPTFYHLET